MEKPKRGFRDRFIVKLAWRTSTPTKNPATSSSAPQQSDTTSSNNSPTPSASGDASLPLTIVPRTEPGQRIFDAALRALTEDDRVLIRSLVNKQDVDGIKGAQDAVLAQKKSCEEKRWTMSVKGNEVGLGMVAGALSQMLGKIEPGIKLVSGITSAMKPGIDLAASIDPLYIGVPVALIKAVLGIAIFKSEQMERLLSGLTTTTFMLQQLSLYFEYFKRVELPAEAKSMEDVLASTYSLIFTFLAAGHRVLARRGTGRSLELLWSKQKLDVFEDDCTGAAHKLEMAANQCARRGAGHLLQLIKEQIGMSKDELNKLATIHADIHTLDVKVDLRGLKTAEGATFDSYRDEHTATCLEGTRIDLLQQINAWARDPHGKCIYWLCGKAGTGKSTIARTAGRALHDSNRLGASFFFKRGEGDRGRAGLFFPTIVRQLADKLPAAKTALASALDADSLLCERNLQQQFERLLLEPFSSLRMLQVSPSYDVIVIDALDECDRDEDMRTILKLLSRSDLAEKLRVRIFVTSRPELPIRLGFKSMDGDLHQDVMLEEVQTTSIRQDLQLYLEHRFSDIRDTILSDHPDSLPPSWPGNDKISALVDLADSLFIFAFTVCRFVAEGDSRECLEMALQHASGRSISGLEEVYLPILQHKVSGRTLQQRKQAIADFKAVVGAIVLLADPLPVASLSNLLNLSASRINNTLKNLHSLLQVSYTAPVRLLHLSFRDFLIDTEGTPAGEYHVDEQKTHARLADQCLCYLSSSKQLKQDICGLAKPGIRRADVSPQKVADCISAEMAYACSYWALHAVQSGEDMVDNGKEHRFLQYHFLHWLEALNWLGRLSTAVAYITQLKSRVKIGEDEQVAAFLDDALRFVLRNRHVIDLAPLQIYHSALVFTPINSIIRAAFQHVVPRTFSCLPDVISKWSAEMLKLEGHTFRVYSVAFSPDGKLLASASHDKTVRVWDAVTGEQRQKFEGYGDLVGSVVFSPDGNLLASASRDKTVQVWNTVTGERRQKLEGHDSVAFSPDGKLLACGSHDGILQLWDAATSEQRQRIDACCGESVIFSPDGKLVTSDSIDKRVRIWEVATGEQKQKLEGHDDKVCSVAFSPDGKLLASGSIDETVRIWDVVTGEQRQKLQEYTERTHSPPYLDFGYGYGRGDWISREVNSVAFSPNGKSLASASNDKTVRMWDTATGELKHKLEHCYSTKLALFSPDGKLLASVSGKVVRVWDAVTGEQRQKLEGHDDEVYSVAFSPDGKLLASASGGHMVLGDNTVRMWDAVTGEKGQKLEGHDTRVNSVALSPDGKLMASASDDRTVRIWDAATGKQRQKFEGHDEEVFSVAFSPDGKLIASASTDRTVRVWDIMMGEQRHKFGGYGGKCFSYCPGRKSLVFSSDGKLLASTVNNEVRVWDVTTGEKNHPRHGFGRNVLAFSPDLKLLATVSFTDIRIWDAATGEQRQKLEKHRGYVCSVAISPDGMLLATDSCADKTLHVWDTTTGKQTQKIELGTHVDELEFSADAGSLLTNVGIFAFGNACGEQTESSTPTLISTPAPLELRRPWIRRHGEDILWLPHEYRGSCYAVYQDTLVIGQASGAVSFFRF